MTALKASMAIGLFRREEIIWQKEQRLSKRISLDSLEAADNLLDSFIEKFDLIAENPQAGGARLDPARDLRRFPVGRYIIFYRPQPDAVEIVRVLHSARDAHAIFTN